MTKENEEQLLRDVKQVRDELHVLKVSITGDPFSKPETIGVLDLLKTLNTELYGDPKIQYVGMKKKLAEQDNRVSVLEDDRKRIYWMCGGISTGVWAVLYIVQWLYGR